LQECRNITAPSSSVCSLNTTPSGARRRQPRQLGLALDQRQRSQILAVEQHRVRGRWSASNTATPSSPATTASPSRVNDLVRSFAAAAAIVGG
jgi:hypothetical protein